MARVWRDGQKRKVYIYRLLATGTIEEKIYQRQVAKQGLSGAVVDDKKGEGSSAAFSLDELRDLFTLRTDTNSETLDLIGRTADNSADAKAPSEGPGRAGVNKKKQQQQLSMDELLKWKQFEPPFVAGSMDDSFFDTVEQDSVSCVFMNCTDPAQAATSGVEIGPDADPKAMASLSPAAPGSGSGGSGSRRAYSALDTDDDEEDDGANQDENANHDDDADDDSMMLAADAAENESEGAGGNDDGHGSGSAFDPDDHDELDADLDDLL